MSAFLVTNDTIDLIVQAAYKYRVIAKRQRTMFGQQLWQANQQSLHEQYPSESEPTYSNALWAYSSFTPFPRKLRRTAISGAIACFGYQSSDSQSWATSEVKRLLDVVEEKNAVASGFVAVIESVPVLGDDGNPLTVAEPQYNGAGEEVGFVGEFQTTYVVTRTAAVNMRAVPNGSSESFWNIVPAQRDPESTDFVHNVMVRPIAIVQAERAVEAERIRLERMAAVAAQVAMEQDDTDNDDDDWDIEDGDDA